MILAFDSSFVEDPVEWVWKDPVKCFWKTWKPKISDIEIISDLPGAIKSKVRKELYEGIMQDEHPKTQKSKGIFNKRL